MAKKKKYTQLKYAMDAKWTGGWGSVCVLLYDGGVNWFRQVRNGINNNGINIIEIFKRNRVTAGLADCRVIFLLLLLLVD